MELNRMLTDAEQRGDLLIGQPLRKPLQDLEFPFGERFDQRLIPNFSSSGEIHQQRLNQGWSADRRASPGQRRPPRHAPPPARLPAILFQFSTRSAWLASPGDLRNFLAKGFCDEGV